LSRNRTALAALILLTVAILCNSGCAVPLAPEYDVKKETVVINFTGGTSGSQPELKIRTTYSIENTGTTPLDFMDVDLPNAKVFGRTNLAVELDKKPVIISPLPPDQQFSLPDAMRIPFGSPLEKNSRRELKIEYTFRAPVLSGTQITLNPGDFHLGTRGWEPVPLPPRHVLSPEPIRPLKREYSVTVPSDFVLVARGKSAGMKKSGAETEYHFKLNASDFNIYVVAGRYAESAKSGDAASFWTHDALAQDPAHAAQEIAGAWAVMEKQFGPLDKNVHTAHIVESEGFGLNGVDTEGATALAFPGGALVNPPALALGVNSDQFLNLATQALASGWFSNKVYPTSNDVIGISGGLAGYATIVIDEARGGAQARTTRIADYIHRYDKAVRDLAGQQKDGKPLEEEPIVATLPDDPYAERAVGLAKAPLFYAALDDECGGEPVRKGLVSMMDIMAGQEVDFEVMRSSIEYTCKKDLVGTFRAWLNNTGLPAGFREKYAPDSH
jgi:hypothetical protein